MKYILLFLFLTACMQPDSHRDINIDAKAVNCEQYVVKLKNKTYQKTKLIDLLRILAEEDSHFLASGTISCIDQNIKLNCENEYCIIEGVK